jgi:putative transposase
MQTRNYLPKTMYAKSMIDTNEYSQIAYERKEKILLFNKLRKNGCDEALALEAINTPRSTLYRWKAAYKNLGLRGLECDSTTPRNPRKPQWDRTLEQKVLSLRKQNPLYGKAKIAKILKRDWNILTSVSTAGRIISSLIKRGLIKKASFYYARQIVKPRIFNGHAQRWKAGMKAKNPGEYVQIDHMSVAITSGFVVKHFQAICPITKIVVEEAYTAATSNNARNFLKEVCKKMPFPITSIQVDGGSEFRGEFEQACEDFAIPLYVLPPRSPELNGNVERANGAAKFEFYYMDQQIYDLSSLRVRLKHFVKKYNTFRPHQALQYLTPLEYYQQLEAKKVSYVMN